MQLFAQNQRLKPQSPYNPAIIFGSKEKDELIIPELCIDEDGISGVGSDSLHKYKPQDLINFLKKQGFKYVKTHGISVSD